MNFIEIIKSIILGLVEGITEWLPISSTGHMILVNEFIGNSGFTSKDLYIYVIQLGAILAVVTLYFGKLFPFMPSKTKEQRLDTWKIWFKILIACIPAGVLGLLFEPYMEAIEGWEVVSLMLIVYGFAFMMIEKRKKTVSVQSIEEMSYKTALYIGLFQVLSIIPGTSRSGATILGAMLIGCSRTVAAEFSFFLAIPVMVGVSAIKILKYGLSMSASDGIVLLVGMAVSYIVSMLSIKFLTGYVKEHSFRGFGIYRIILGFLVILYFVIPPIVEAICLAALVVKGW